MQRGSKGKYWLAGLLAIWVVVNLLQGLLTELDPDEAYYWMYARQLDWGYFDHPPAAALFIYLGSCLLPGELGVRLFFILAQALSIYFIWLLADKPSGKWENITLLGLLAAMPMLQVYGFIATPDGPLLFFTALFFYLYQRYWEEDNLANAILLGICMAALLYSKYHGILLIFFVLLSNLRLLRRPSFYLAGFLGFLLFFPHLYWQYEHGFPSFLYHLQGRDDVYKLKYTTTYLLNQAVLFSPLLFPLVAIALWRRPLRGVLGRAFYFVIYGFWGFFFYASFKGHVEPQWTAILSIPFALLLYHQAAGSPRFGKWARILAGATVFLLLIARLELAFHLSGRKSNFNNRSWAYALKEKAEGYPMLFHNSYRNASKYNFYTQSQAYAYTDVDYRPSQFDIWDWEKALHNQSVLVVGEGSWKCQVCPPLKLPGKGLKTIIADSLQAAQKVEATIREKLPPAWRRGQSVQLRGSFYNPYPHEVAFGKGSLPLQARGVFFREGVFESAPVMALPERSLSIAPGDTAVLQLAFIVPDSLRGKYEFGLGLSWGALPPFRQVAVQEIRVE